MILQGISMPPSASPISSSKTTIIMILLNVVSIFPKCYVLSDNGLAFIPFQQVDKHSSVLCFCYFQVLRKLFYLMFIDFFWQKRVQCRTFAFPLFSESLPRFSSSFYRSHYHSSNRTSSSFEELERGMCHCCGLSGHVRSGAISSTSLSVKSRILYGNAPICLHRPLALALQLQAPNFTRAVCLLSDTLVLYCLFLVMEAFTRLSKKRKCSSVVWLNFIFCTCPALYREWPSRLLLKAPRRTFFVLLSICLAKWANK